MRLGGSGDERLGPAAEQLLRRLVGQQSELMRLRAEVTELKAALRRKERHIATLESYVAEGGGFDAAARLAQLQSSTSWRVTQPLRTVAERSPQATAAARRLAKIAWWTVSLQLPAKLRARRAARSERADRA